MGKRGSAKVVTQSQLAKVKAEGGTNLSDGVELGMEQFESSAARQVLVVVADGDSDDGYPTQTAKQFKDNGGVIYTVGFTFSGKAFNALASDDDHALLADDDTQLGEAMDEISANITAMIVDPMGEHFSLKGDVEVSGITDGVLNATSNLITWYPGGTQLNGNNNTVTLKYTVQLKDDAKAVGVHDKDPLNGEALLQYKVSSNGQEGKPINALFPQPKAHYEVGSLTVKYLDAKGSPIPEFASFDPVPQVAVTDWEGADFTRKIAPPSRKLSDSQSWLYQKSTLDGAPADNSGEPIKGDAKSHTLIHYYDLYTTHTVSYEYTGDIPAGAPALPGTRVYGEGTQAVVEAPAVLEGYDFSGWATGDAEVENGKFTVNSDVTFTGSWTVKPSYTVLADFFTSTDGAEYIQDNQEPWQAQGKTYGDYQTYKAETTQTYNVKTYVLVGEPAISTEGGHTTVTLRYEREASTEVDYDVVHQYFVRTDGVLADEAEYTAPAVILTGNHGETITADSVNSILQQNGYSYTETGRTGDIILDKTGEKQTITVSYVRDRWTVETLIDDNGTISPATKAYDAGSDVTVSWNANTGYYVSSVTVDGADMTEELAEKNSMTFSGLDISHSVAVTTAPCDYSLRVVYVFTDKSTHEGFENSTTSGHHIGDGYTVLVPEAPAGYTFNPDASSASNGTFGAGDVTVTLTYTANGSATALVRYVDTADGSYLPGSTLDTVKVGQWYNVSDAKDVTVIDKDGVLYDFDGVDERYPADADYVGEMPDGGVTIYRYYSARPTYTVSYLPGDHGTFAEENYSGLYAGTDTPKFLGETAGDEGWVFAGWSPEVNGQVSEGGDIYTALWNELPKFTVVYEFETSTNGGGYENSGMQTVVDGIYVNPGVSGHTAPDAFTYDGHSYSLSGPAEQFTGILDYGESAILTFTYQRRHFGAVDYKVEHIYRTFTGDSMVETQDGTDLRDARGTHSSTVLAADVEKLTQYGGRNYAFNAADSDVSLLLGSDASQTLTLYYDRFEYGVTVIGDEGVASVSGEGSYEKGADASVSWTLKPGWHITGVAVNNVSQATDQDVSIQSIQADQTVEITTARTSYTVTYYVDYGSGYTEFATESHYYGDALSAHSFPTAAPGQSFSGWAPAVPGTMPAENVDIYGSFSAIDYSVSYQPGEHGTFEAQVTDGLNYGDLTPGFDGEMTAAPGWTFAGWSPEVSERVEGSAVYTAQWTQAQFELKTAYVFTDGSTHEGYEGSVQGLAFEAPYAVEAKVAPAGYHAVGEPSIVGADALAGAMPANNVTITFTYAPNGTETVTVRYFTRDEQGANVELQPSVVVHSGLIGTSYALDEAAVAPAQIVTAEGKVYLSPVVGEGSAPFTGVLDGAKVIDLFYSEQDRFTLSYQFTGTVPSGMTAPSGGSYYPGTELTIAPAPAAPANYTFEGWVLPEGLVRQDDTIRMPGADVTIVGNWTYQYPGPVWPDEPNEPDEPNVPDEPDEPDVDIPDEEPPLSDLPDEPAGDSGDEPSSEVEITDEETPLADVPVLPGDGETEEVVIVDEEVPLGNLPQTGTTAQAATPWWTLGLLAVMASMAAAGLSISISRKREDEDEA